MTSLACDTSVLVAALLPWHDAHDESRATLAHVTHLPAQVLLETYSVLTRLPAPHRQAPAVVAEALAELHVEVVGLPDDAIAGLPRRLCVAGIAGGASYDGLIATTVVHHEIPLHSHDARARRTYTRLGVDLV